MMYEIHSVVVKKPVELKTAMKYAKDILKGQTKNYYIRETKQSYRISKDKNLYEKFKSKIVNDKITIIFGKVKQNGGKMRLQPIPTPFYGEGKKEIKLYKKGREYYLK